MIKKLFCYMLSLCLMVLSVDIKAYAIETESEIPREITLSMYSNLCKDTTISGLYADNVFYIPLEKLCDIVDGKIVSQSDKEAVIEVAIRSFVLAVGSGSMVEKMNHGNNNIKMPSMYVDGKIYVSALHFLTYIGAVVELNENTSPQFIVIKRYDIFDALAEMADKNSGHFFWWDEFDIEFKDLRNKIVNAGLVALISKDSNVFRMMFDAKGMEQDAVEEALLAIVQNEAAEYFDNSDAESERISNLNDGIGVVSDWIELVSKAYNDVPGLSNQIKKIVEKISEGSGEVSTSTTYVTNVYEAVESLKQFDNISATQKDLLANTILKYAADSKTLNNQWGVVIEAAEEVDDKIQGEYVKQIDFATQIAESTVFDFIDSAAAAKCNPVAMAWDGAILLTKLIPASKEMIDKKSKLYNAYNCSMIQLIANEMLVEAYSDWYYGDFSEASSLFRSSNPSAKLNDIKQLLILQLKSTLTAREYLISSGFVDEDYTNRAKEINEKIAILLNKIEGCYVPKQNMFSVEYDGDIMWMADMQAVAITEDDWNSLLFQGSSLVEMLSRGIDVEMLCRYHIYHSYKLPIEISEDVDIDPLNNIASFVRYGKIAKIPIESLKWIAEHVFNSYNIDFTQTASAAEAYDSGIGAGFYPYEGYYYYYEISYVGWEDCIAYSICNYDILEGGQIYAEVQIVTPYEIYPIYILGRIESKEGKKYWAYETISRNPLEIEFSGENIHVEPAYKKAYADFILEHFDYNQVFKFICLDGDEIPELIVTPYKPNHADVLKIYSYVDGEVVEIGGIGGSFGKFWYAEKGNYIVSNYYGMNLNTYYRYEIVDNVFKCIFWTNGEWDGTAYTSRKNGGEVEDITKEQFNQYVEEMLNIAVNWFEPEQGKYNNQAFVYRELRDF